MQPAAPGGQEEGRGVQEGTGEGRGVQEEVEEAGENVQREGEAVKREKCLICKSTVWPKV